MESGELRGEVKDKSKDDTEGCGRGFFDSGSLKIVPMNDAHIDGVALIEKACFSDPWSAEGIRAELTNPTALFFVAEHKKKAIGYIGVHIVADEGYIANLAVLPSFRGKGIGKALLCEVIKKAERKNLSFLTLEVRPSNAAAVSLYALYGFKVVGKRKNFYTNPREDGLIMTRLFTQVKVIKENKKDFLDLLLLADEQENMIDKYLDRGTLFALYCGDLKSICVVTDEGDGNFEIKNFATHPKYQRQGYGKFLIDYVCNYYKDNSSAIYVGTGESKSTISFYENCGFEISHKVKNFFTDNYDEPMFEDGIQLVDMIYLKKAVIFQSKKEDENATKF
ncbi:hypothetical protein AGMMS50284_3330 [Clostridia bacterium]|nr:hypothetical protein AGMMS50284_3330 [Clostridia bacterium]